MLTLIETKAHLRVEGTDEDAVIQAMIDAATAATGDYLNFTTALDITAAAPIKSATLLMVADLYENRERQSEQQLYTNRTYERLLNPYRVMEA